MTPWHDPLSPWKSSAAYFTWLRGGLRRLWMRHPISKRFKNSLCRPARPEDGLGPRVKQVGLCARCGLLKAKSALEVDHVIPAGPLGSWDDLTPFAARLLGASSENLRLLCKPCHDVVTASERFQCSEEEAKRRKALAAFKKLRADKQRLLLLGLNLDQGDNTEQRADIYRAHLNSLDAPH